MFQQFFLLSFILVPDTGMVELTQTRVIDSSHPRPHMKLPSFILVLTDIKKIPGHSMSLVGKLNTEGFRW